MIDEGEVIDAKARAAERRLCVRAVRAQADDYRMAARAMREGAYVFDKQKRGKFITSAEALEQMALILEDRQ